MLLGKRTRPPMKRTTSMTEFTLDLNLNPDPSSAMSVNYNNPFDPHNPYTPISPSNTQQLDQQRLLTAAKTVSARNRRKSADFETANFLKACFLCKRCLIPGRDIYMYRGDSAFCSLECRQQQMNLDEKKEKCSLIASRKDFTNSAAIAGGKGSDVSATSETVAAV